MKLLDEYGYEISVTCIILGYIIELIGILAFASTHNQNYLLITLASLILYIYPFKKVLEQAIEDARAEIEVEEEWKRKYENCE